MFNKLNQDGNEYVDKEEYLKGHENVFAKIDANGDDKITEDELKEFQAAKAAQKAEMKCAPGKCGQ